MFWDVFLISLVSQWRQMAEPRFGYLITDLGNGFYTTALLFKLFPLLLSPVSLTHTTIFILYPLCFIFYVNRISSTWRPSFMYWSISAHELMKLKQIFLLLGLQQSLKRWCIILISHHFIYTLLFPFTSIQCQSYKVTWNFTSTLPYVFMFRYLGAETTLCLCSSTEHTR
jgi:hypothetical protein